MAPPITPQRAGAIIALEGPSDLVSTQLRLLPSSPNILVLPSIQHYINGPGPAEQTSFDARALVRRYHQAALARHSEALDFLRPSSSGEAQARLVFTHGGSMSVRVACLSAIMEHEAEGNIEVAYATYSRVVGKSSGRPRTSDSDGEEHTSWLQSPKSASTDKADEAFQHRWDVDDDDSFESRILRAMRAADALDKETEFLQPGNEDVDLTVRLIDIPSRPRPRPRSRLRPRPRESLSSMVSSGAPETHRETSAATSNTRKPPLRIQIPRSGTPLSWSSEAVVKTHRRHSSHFSPKTFLEREPQPLRPKTAEAELSPKEKPENATLFFASPLASPNQTDAREEHALTAPIAGDEKDEQPVEPLPRLEDVVLLLDIESPNEVQEFILERFRDESRSDAQTTVEPDDRDRGRMNSAQRLGCESPWMENALVHGLPTPPGHSPTTASVATDATLYSLSVSQEAAVSVQNHLRSFLATVFPLRDTSYAASDSEDGVWKPLDCDPRRLSSVDGRRLDMILAVGAESRVKRDRVAEIVGQIEKLGFKSSGLCRSGRLDLRYLIANAMQAFTAQPLTKQTSNPFADRTLLAALIIPHLETYLRTHPNVRFLLIEYPAEHLATVLALQALIGIELMKVVGIVHGDSSAQSTDGDRRPSEGEGFRALNPRQGSALSGAVLGACSFSNANFLLSSSASAFETAAFVAAIRESLISVSDYYIPERALYKQPQPEPPQSPPRANRPNVKPIITELVQPTTAPSSSASSRISTSTLVITPPSSPSDPYPTALRYPPPQQRPPSPTIASNPPSRKTASSDLPSRSSAPGTRNGAATLQTSIRRGPTNYGTSSSSSFPDPPLPPPPRTSSAAAVITTTTTAAAAAAAAAATTPAGGMPAPSIVVSVPPSGTSNGYGYSSDPSTERPGSMVVDVSNHEAAGVAISTDRPVTSEGYSPSSNTGRRGAGYYYGDELTLESLGRTSQKGSIAGSSISVASSALSLMDDEFEWYDEDERRLMPLYFRRRRERERERWGAGKGDKALRWLGLV